MHQLQEIIVILIVIIVLGYVYDKLYGLSVSLSEGFLGQTQNFVYTNKNNIANQLEYGEKNIEIRNDPDYPFLKKKMSKVLKLINSDLSLIDKDIETEIWNMV